MSAPALIHALKKVKNWALFQTGQFGREITPSGIAYFPYHGEAESPYLRAIEAPEALMRHLQEMRKKGQCTFRDRKFHLTWKTAYEIAYGPDKVLSELLHLHVVDALKLGLTTTGMAGQDTHDITVTKPRSAKAGEPWLICAAGECLPVTTSGNLLSIENYHLINEVNAFRRRTRLERVAPEADSAWQRIAHLAQAAHADVSRFITQKVTLDIEKLRLLLKLPSRTGVGEVVELVPYFTGSPSGWREVFLKESRVLNVYDVPTPTGRMQVEIAECVQPILYEAKRLQGRPAKGSARLLKRLQMIDETDVEDMSPEAFEQVCALIYRKLGYEKSFRVGGAGDGGVDVVCLKGDQGLLLQCKSSKELDKRLGWEGVKDVVAGEAAYRLQYPGIFFQKIALTNQFFNDTAKTQAKINNVTVMDKTDILREIRKLHISYFELSHFCKGSV